MTERLEPPDDDEHDGEYYVEAYNRMIAEDREIDRQPKCDHGSPAGHRWKDKATVCQQQRATAAPAV